MCEQMKTNEGCTQGTLTIKIDKKVTEQFLIENCLNMKCSGYNNEAVLLLYALDKRWNINKLTYYLKLMKDANK